MSLTNQLKSVIQWENPNEDDIYYKYTLKSDEIKNTSKLILQPGQGCILTYEGSVKGVFDEEGIYNLKSDNKPFITTILKYLSLRDGSEHIVGIWFYRKAEIVNIRWGTRIPIKYNDPVYSFPVQLRCFGNYSVKVIQPKSFFTNVVAGKELYSVYDLQELLLSRISQPIANYLANAKFSYAEIDSHIEAIARDAQEKTEIIFTQLGFEIADFKIEGTSFDDETNQRINEISETQAEVKASQIAGVSFEELQRLKALRDIAKNEGSAGAGMGLMTGVNLGQDNQQTFKKDLSQKSIKQKLVDLKELFEDGLITEEEFLEKKKKYLDEM